MAFKIDVNAVKERLDRKREVDKVKGKNSPERLLEEIIKLEPVQFIGVCKIIGVDIYETEVTTGEKIDENYTTRPAKVRILKIDEEKNNSRIQITIHEGKNRQVRKMCEAVGKKVLALHRCKIGNIDVKDLKIGEWRYLTNKEVNNLKS